MSMVVEIPEELALRIQQRAAAMGTAPEQVALNAIQQQLTAEENYDRLTAPIHQAFLESGMTEEEAVELFEAEKHAMRRERRALNH